VVYAIYRLTGNKRISIIIYSILFFPGTFIHEMSHFLTALFLLVPISDVHILPRFKEDDKVKLGSVETQKVDFIRNFLVGTAPFIFGIVIIFTLSNLFIKQYFPLNSYMTFLFGYIIFQVANSMYLSGADMIAGWEFIVFLLFIFGIGYFLEVRLNFIHFDNFTYLIGEISKYLLFPIFADMILIVILKYLPGKR